MINYYFHKCYQIAEYFNEHFITITITLIAIFLTITILKKLAIIEKFIIYKLYQNTLRNKSILIVLVVWGRVEKAFLSC